MHPHPVRKPSGGTSGCGVAVYQPCLAVPTRLPNTGLLLPSFAHREYLLRISTVQVLHVTYHRAQDLLNPEQLHKYLLKGPGR